MKKAKAHALVTGGGRRIGRALSIGLAREHIRVTVHYNTSEEAANDTCEQIRSEGGTAHAIQADLSEEKAVHNLVSDITEEIAPLNILINNASIFDHTSVQDTTREHWKNHMNINLTAPVVLMQELARHRPDEKRGRIINLLDWRSERPQSEQFAYSVSKAGLAAATRAAARELAPDVSVNGIAPGPILPPEDQTEEKLNHIISDLPVERWGNVEDVVEAAMFFIHASTFVTGEILHVDGGRQLV